MPAPSNQTPATALPMSMVYSIVIPDLDLATPAPNCDLWWSYVPVAGDRVIGFWAGEYTAASYNPQTTVWTGPIGSLVELPLGIFADNVPLQIPVTVGETYYFRVRNSSGITPASGVSCTVSALKAPNFTAPAGSILINDDTPGFPAALVSVADGSVLQFVNDFPAGEEGDSLDNGTMLFYDSDAGNMKRFTVTGGVIAAPTTVALDVEAIRVNLQTQAFFVATQSNPATVRRVAGDGSIGATIWTLTHNSVFALATNLDESIAYYSQRTAGSAIHTFDLGPSTPGSDLAAGIGAAFVRDILYLTDDTLLACYVITGTGETNVLHYNPAGSVLHTYGPYTSAIPGGTQPRLAYDTAGSGAFWLWIHGTGGDAGLSFFHKIQISTGTILLTVESTEYETGVYNRTPTASPSARFGNSFSCPTTITRVSIEGPESPTPTPPDPDGGGGYTLVPHTRRRVRVCSPLSEEMVRAFHKSLVVDVETGVGVNDDAQGYDPQIMLRHSDDGQHTWSSVKTRSLGKQGEYSKLVRYGPLGMARQRSYEISTSEPVRTNLIGGYLEAEAGVS